jgi:hypothetical protein
MWRAGTRVSNAHPLLSAQAASARLTMVCTISPTAAHWDGYKEATGKHMEVCAKKPTILGRTRRLWGLASAGMTGLSASTTEGGPSAADRHLGGANGVERHRELAAPPGSL